LRKALRQALNFYSPQQMIDASARLAKGWTFRDTALRTFNDGSRLLQEN